MTALVLDASAAVNVLLPSKHRSTLVNRLVNRDVWAPQIVDLEVLSAVARLQRSGEVTRAEADGAMDAWARMPLDRIDNELVSRQVWRLRDVLRISDAFYVAAAQLLEAELLTCDARLGRAPLRDVVLTVVQ